jgi:hypothetical protein
MISSSLRMPSETLTTSFSTSDEHDAPGKAASRLARFTPSAQPFNARLTPVSRSLASCSTGSSTASDSELHGAYASDNDSPHILLAGQQRRIASQTLRPGFVRGVIYKLDPVVGRFPPAFVPETQQRKNSLNTVQADARQRARNHMSTSEAAVRT